MKTAAFVLQNHFVRVSAGLPDSAHFYLYTVSSLPPPRNHLSIVLQVLKVIIIHYNTT